MPIDFPSDPKSQKLPENVTEQLQELEIQQLKRTIHYAQHLIADRDESAAEVIDEDRDDILRMEERSGYTEVVRHESLGDVLYHVTQESRADGSTELNWRYIGPVVHGQ